MVIINSIAKHGDPTMSASLALSSQPSSRFFAAAVPMDAPPQRRDGLAVDSSALLQGQKAVTILHNGAIYRLQATKLGKLILTK
jgi:hemin uptake protein HemP